MTLDKKGPGENQMRIIWFALTSFSVLVIVAMAVAVIWGIGKFLNLLSPVIWPLAIATVLAYLLDPLVNWLARRGITRAWGIVIVFVAVLGVVAGVMAAVIPQMVKESNKLISKIPAYTAQAQQRLSEWVERAEKAATTTQPNQTTNAPPNQAGAQTNSPASANSGTNSVSPEVSSNMKQIHSKLMASASDWVGKLFSTVGAWLLAQLAKATALIDVLIALILIPLFTYYFLSEKPWIKTHWTNYLPIRDSRLKNEMVFILSSINGYMVAFFRGQVLVSICSGVLYTIGFLAVGLDYAFLLGFFCMIFTMIPFLGSIINCIVALVLTAMQFGDWSHPLMIVVVFSLVVSLENFFYSPRIMGHRVNLHPAIVIVAVMIGITLLGGVLGGVLSIPLAAALRVILFRYLWKGEKQH